MKQRIRRHGSICSVLQGRLGIWRAKTQRVCENSIPAKALGVSAVTAVSYDSLRMSALSTSYVLLFIASRIERRYGFLSFGTIHNDLSIYR